MTKKAVIDTASMRGKKTQKLSGDVSNNELKIARPKPAAHARCESPGCTKRPAWAGASFCEGCGRAYATHLRGG